MRKSKDRRIEVIQDILKKGDVHTQTELRKRLKKKGLDVSQATISRDLKELGYIRAPIGDGTYRIVKVEGGRERIDLLFKLGNAELMPVDNIIIIKTKPGNAHALAGAIDRTRIDGIVGTVAGDDTIFAVTRNKSTAQKVIKNLKRYIE